MSDFSHLPSGYHSVTPSLTVQGAAQALEFYARAFGAVEIFRLPDPDGVRLGHAEFTIGNSILMISDEYPEMGAMAPALGQGGNFMIYVPDVDAAFATAVQAGATVKSPPTDMFWGDRHCSLADPYGYRWSLAQKTKALSPEEIDAGAKQWFDQNLPNQPNC